jgi:hypothetical protein
MLSTKPLIVVTALLLMLPMLAQSAQTNTFKAKFTAEYSFPEKPPTAKNGRARGGPQTAAPQLPKIPGAGEVSWAEPDLRVDFTNGLNQESMRLLVNFDTGKATMLYPDTLNGYRTDLKALDAKGYLPIARDFLSRRIEDYTPKGFARKNAGSETVNGVKCTHTQYARDDGTQVELWRRKSGDPVRILAQTSKGKLRIEVTEYKRGVSLGPETFAVDDSYQLKDVKEPPAELGLPQ